jgi:DMSO/TMAO reductase YedYZ molybdopterin-dependent catalytic subunit
MSQPPRWSRRRFLMTALLAAACRPERSAPTLYQRGMAQLPTETPNLAAALAATLPPLPIQVPITPLNRLYEKSFRGTPDLSNAAEWSLTLDGLVNNPLQISLTELHAMPQQSALRTLQCISNPVGGGLIGTWDWQGVPLAPLLARAAVLPSARYALFEAADGYTTSVALEWLTQPDVLLITGAHGEALPPRHGFPLRILIPGLYGQKQPKWITRITFATEDRLGYWEGSGREWSNLAAIKTNSAFRQPIGNLLPFAAPIYLEGYAFGGERAIKRVAISAVRADVQGQPLTWQPAALITPPSPLVWTWWYLLWTPPQAGLYRLAVRATDESGFTQAIFPNSLIGAAFPDGTDAIHALSVRLRA